MASTIAGGGFASNDLYGGKDPRDLARYSYSEAARATGVPASTIASWVKTKPTRKVDGEFFRPVIERPGEGRLSFYNLIEVHVLRSLRTKHSVQLEHVRQAAEVAEAQYRIPRLLLSEQLRFTAGHVFLERYGEIVQLSPVEQLVIKGMFEAYMSRIEFEGGVPSDFSPLERLTDTGRKLILVSPFISFGRPVIRRLGITTQVIAERINAGDSEDEVIHDFGLLPAELKEALAYESAA
jgi:uncharacterized protein (DUF433 family)